MTTAYIATGANLGKCAETIGAALDRLNELEGIEVVARSHLIETMPVDCPADAGVFQNGAAILETTLSAEALLDALLNVEREFGRDRSRGQNAPRTLDLDLLLFGEQVIKTDRLELPHPRMHLRDFVLVPLAHIAPNVAHPVLSTTIADLLAALAKNERSLESDFGNTCLE